VKTDQVNVEDRVQRTQAIRNRPQKANVDQRGPNSFDLRAILHKHDNSRAISNKLMYETKKGKISECVIEITVLQWQFITNLYQ